MAIKQSFELLNPSEYYGDRLDAPKEAPLNSLAKLPGLMREETLEPFKEILLDFPRDPCSVGSADITSIPLRASRRSG